MANDDVSAVPPRPVTVASDAPTLELANEGVMNTIFGSHNLPRRHPEERWRQDIDVQIYVHAEGYAWPTARIDGDRVDLVTVAVVEAVRRIEIVIEHAVKARLRHDEITDVRQAGGVVADFSAVRCTGDEHQPQDQRGFRAGLEPGVPREEYRRRTYEMDIELSGHRQPQGGAAARRWRLQRSPTSPPRSPCGSCR